MLKVKYYNKDHTETKEIDNVEYVNFYPQDNLVCVHALNVFGLRVLSDIPMSEIITVE